MPRYRSADASVAPEVGSAEWRRSQATLNPLSQGVGGFSGLARIKGAGLTGDAAQEEFDRSNEAARIPFFGAAGAFLAPLAFIGGGVAASSLLAGGAGSAGVTSAGASAAQGSATASATQVGAHAGRTALQRAAVRGGARVAGSLLSGSGGGGGGPMPTYGFTMAPTGDLGRAATRGAQAEDDYFTRAGRFDPMASIERYARGAGDVAREGFREDLRDLQGDAVGRGRLDTGFYDEDVGSLWRDTQRDLNSRISMQAGNAAGLELENMRGMGEAGSRSLERYYDWLASVYDRQTAERNSRRNASAQRWGALAGAAGSVAGAVL